MRFTAIFTLLLQAVFAQTPEVPHKMNFAGMTLTIRDDARREIQKDVDALTQYPKYFTIKVERAKTYFPIIEKIFEEERLPDDFKYLVLQESALIPDAVSVSNAVGFWQFKDFTAVEMGLRVDKEIDERMNIVSSTRAAARYLKKNNTFFNNWLYALQAYQMGAGGVMRSIKDYESGTKHMVITSQTYWYVKKFLAHKIAFEGSVKGHGEVKVIEYENRNSKSMGALAKEISVPEETLMEYNKWARKGTIPGDRNYIVSIPVKGEAQPVFASIKEVSGDNINSKTSHKKLDAKPALATQRDKKTLNGLLAIKAQANENAVALSKRAGVGLSLFLACNDLSISEPLIEGQYYYLKKKKSKTQVASHVVQLSNETLWSVSQQYGIQLKRLARLNPGLPASSLTPGTMVVLSGAPSKTVISTEASFATVEMETGDFFNWTVNSTASTRSAVAKPDSPTQAETMEEKIDRNSAEQTPEQGNTSITGDVSVQVVPLPAVPDQHIVVPGETLYAISKKYNIAVMDIVGWNQLKMEDGIKPGQVLKLKDEVSQEAAQVGATIDYVMHEVKPSDTLYSVARKYGVTIKEVMDWNQKKDFNVVTGEKLRIQVK